MIPKIKRVEFGNIHINDKIFNKDDFFLFWDSVEAAEKTHYPDIGDLKKMLLREPDVIIFGTGFSNCVEISDEIKEETAKHTVKLIVLSTPDALKMFSDLVRKNKVAARIHITC